MEIVLLLILLVLLAEVSYLVWRTYSNRQKTSHRRVLVDTSVVIDGRITSLAKSGIIGDTLVILRSVVGELQLLADGADSEKRARARQGLDTIAELQAMDHVDVEIYPDSATAREGVDNRLLELAKKQGAALMTIDFNLAKVAIVEHIQTININEIAKELRLSYQPGEHAKINLTTKGNDQQQAVGHLDDGTMVVVEHAKSKIGQTVEVEFTRGLQTSAGRMMFGRLVKQDDQADHSPQTNIKNPKGRASRPAAPRKKELRDASSQSASSTARTSRPQKGTAQKATSNASTTKKKSQPSRGSSSRRNNEDKLIALVNNQSE